MFGKCSYESTGLSKKKFYVAGKIALSLLVLVSPTNSNAQDNAAAVDANAEQALVERWMAVYDDINQSLTVSAEVDGSDRAILERQTLLTLVNPEFSGRHGRIYLWTEKGRPIIVSSFLSQIERARPHTRWVIYEFHSLSQGSVEVTRGDEGIWECPTPGIEWFDGPKDLTPATNASRRLTQMRAIAQRYSARSLRREFRLMTQPIYRYPSDTPGVTDGAIFSFGITTDPCVLLLIEARKDSWYLAFARSNREQLTVSKGSEVVWSRELLPSDRLRTGPFFLLWTAEQRLADDPSTVLSKKFGN